jgi:hypothetical protein
MMRDFYAPFFAAGPAGPGPRPAPPVCRPRTQHVLPLAANPHVAFSGVVLDRLAAVLAGTRQAGAGGGRQCQSPPPHELAALDLAACIEPLSDRVSYLPARGLPRTYVDTAAPPAASSTPCKPLRRRPR